MFRDKLRMAKIGPRNGKDRGQGGKSTQDGIKLEKTVETGEQRRCKVLKPM